MKCPICSTNCDRVVPDSNPSAAEFYCASCHKSYPVPGMTKTEPVAK